MRAWRLSVARSLEPGREEGRRAKGGWFARGDWGREGRQSGCGRESECKKIIIDYY